MRTASLLTLAALFLGLDADTRWVERLAFWTWGPVQKLDQELHSLAGELEAMPVPAFINSTTRIGLKTGYTTGEDLRWLQVELPQEARVDAVVLAPSLGKGARAVVAGYGFPVRFKLEVMDARGMATTVMDYTERDFPNPACYPVIARFPPRPVQSVRLTATEPWAVDGPEILAIAEMYILSGRRNLAPAGKVTSSSSRNAPRAWTRPNLVDSITPLGLPLSPHPPGIQAPAGFHSAVSQMPEAAKSLTLTLAEAATPDEIVLFPVRHAQVPLWFDYGFPATYRVEAALQADFSDAVLLREITDPLHPGPGMNPVVIPVGRPVRHLRITATRLWYRDQDYVFALAEVQVLKNGTNLTGDARFSASDELAAPDAHTAGSTWTLAALNDGFTDAGEILPLPEWLEDLARRQPMEQRHNELLQHRRSLLARAQKQLAYGSLGSLALLSAAFGLILWRQRQERLLAARRLQDKLARDLHDEIGSNLGSITLICSLASQPGATAESIRADLAEVGRVAEESASSMRDMVELLRPAPTTPLGRDWLDILSSLTERLLRGVELDCALPAAPLTRQPDLETRREIYLFCKEVLHNIARHASATRVRFHLHPAAEGLNLEITDNGTGFDPDRPAAGHGLGNLRARAQAMKAALYIESRTAPTPGHGTTVRLFIPRTSRWTAC